MTANLSTNRSRIGSVALALAASFAIGCGPRDPQTDAERLAKGREVVQRVSQRLEAAPTLTVTTREVRDEVHSGKPTQVTVTRQTVVRKPDRLYFKTTGDRGNEGFYDGVGLTLVMHKHKVFGQARMPETLDRTLDAIHERYGVAVPLADFVYSSPAKALMHESTTGGWVDRQRIEGVEVDHLAFRDTGVAWELWVPTSGEPLPVRMVAEFQGDSRLKKSDTTFSDWNLAPAAIADGRFKPHVPPDYEGIAMIQRAAVLRNMQPDAEGEKEKKSP